MDPYNNNPFRTDTSRESKSEYAANRELAKTATDNTLREIRGIFGTLKTDKHGFWTFK